MPARATAPYLSLVDRLYWRLRPGAMPYFHVLDRVHQHLRPRSYLEVGVSTGGSMTLSLPGTRNVGVDPDPKIALPVSSTTSVFRETSDAFFASHDLRDLLGGLPLDLAFIDGMHHFEYALRDFMNIERHASRATTVLIHDCYPIDETSAARVRSTEKWSGDVWKLILCLKEQRPDLSVSVVDVGPTGLGIVTGLDPTNRTLEDRYQELEASYVAMPYSRLEADKAGTLNRVPDDWDRVRSLLPDRPFRSGSLAVMVTGRWLRARWPVARRSFRRTAATVRRRLHLAS